MSKDKFTTLVMPYPLPESGTIVKPIGLSALAVEALSCTIHCVT